MTCPHCETLAAHEWQLAFRRPSWDDEDEYTNAIPGGLVSICSSCSTWSIWVGERMVHPSARIGPVPQPDMPEGVLELYQEAREVGDISPRAAGALLRVALERLTQFLGYEDKKLDAAIGELVAEGRLDPDLQRAMDALRITGNDAAHPGEVRLDDEAGGLTALFEMINVIVERLVSIPTRVAKIYDALPPTKLEAIERRDAQAKDGDS